MNNIVSTLDFQALPWVTEVFRATAGVLSEDNPARAGVLNNLGSASQLHYLRSDDLAHLEDAIAYYRSASDTAHSGDQDLVLYRCNLVLALNDHAKRTNSAESAAEAVAVSVASVFGGISRFAVLSTWVFRRDSGAAFDPACRAG